MTMPKLGWRDKEGNVAKIIVNKQSKFDEGLWVTPDSEVIIYYYVSI